MLNLVWGWILKTILEELQKKVELTQLYGSYPHAAFGGCLYTRRMQLVDNSVRNINLDEEKNYD